MPRPSENYRNAGGIVSANENDIVYHYCSVDAFLSIIQNSKLWLSDVLKSNDKLEYLWMRNRVNKELESSLKSENLNLWEEHKQVSSEANDLTLLTACFSEAEDLLSQWRGYANDGEGVAIGFSKSCLQKINEGLSFLKFDNVVYDEQKQVSFINDKVQEEIEFLRRLQTQELYALEEEYHRNSLDYAFYKNPSFSEEREMRIVFNYITWGHQNLGHIEPTYFQYSHLKFRSANNKIVAYIEMDIGSFSNDIIKKIYIGPKAKVTKRDIQNVLHHSMFSSRVDIEDSKSSYR